MGIFLLQAIASSPGELLQTDSFSVKFPSGWKVNHGGKPIQVNGPDNTVMSFSSYKVSGEGSESEIPEIRNQIEAAAIESIKKMVQENKLLEQLPLREKQLNDGSVFKETLATTSDNLQYVGHFIVSKNRTVLFVTVEGPTTSVKLFSTAREAVMNIKWK